jgi:hypothetical protein
MERVIKRYLMHNQGDSDDPKQNEFDDIKQDLQTLRYEIINDMKKTREDNSRNMNIINGGLQFVSEEILNNSKGNQQSFFRYRELLSLHQNLLNNAGMPSSLLANFATEFIESENKANNFSTSSESGCAAAPVTSKNGNQSDADEPRKSTTISPEIVEVEPIMPLQNMKSFNNRAESAEEFYRNRLEYDFHAVFDDD